METLKLQISIDSRKDSSVLDGSDYVKKFFLISTDDMNDNLCNKLITGYDIAVKQFNNPIKPMIFIPITGEQASWSACMYEGLYLIPLRLWDLVVISPKILLVNDFFLMNCVSMDFENIALNKLHSFVQPFKNMGWLMENHNSSGLLVFGVPWEGSKDVVNAEELAVSVQKELDS